MEFNKLMRFVPSSPQPLTEHIEQFAQHIMSCRKLLILTGAGISTESGIPDYRSKDVGLYARKLSGPVQYQAFLKSDANRQRYWARNYMGWPMFSSFQPNIVHKTIYDWENRNKIFHTISQNVDNLHIKSGLRNLVELHGNTHSVVCINCNFRMMRHRLQKVLDQLNPHFSSQINDNAIAPDGDFLVDDKLIQSFRYPDCFECKGILKPDIVFFGDNIPKARKEFVANLVDLSDGLLCLGSSLQTFSSFVIVKRGHERNIPIGIINIGDTRADHLTSFRLRAQLGYVLPKLDALTP